MTVADLMDTEPVTIPGDLPLLQAHDEFFLRYGWPWFCVVDEQHHFLGMLRAERVDGALAAGQPVLPARELLDAGDERRSRFRSTTPLQALMHRAGPAGARRAGRRRRRRPAGRRRHARPRAPRADRRRRSVTRDTRPRGLNL